MGFDWKKHAECADSVGLKRWACNADRAEMIAEGERLRAEMAREWSEHVEKEIALKAENERLQAELDLLRIDGFKAKALRQALNECEIKRDEYRSENARLRERAKELIRIAEGLESGELKTWTRATIVECLGRFRVGFSAALSASDPS